MLQRMVRGEEGAGSYQTIIPPPPGWLPAPVLAGAVTAGLVAKQSTKLVQFAMLPWADPQALHEMMRQGVSRCALRLLVSGTSSPVTLALLSLVLRQTDGAINDAYRKSANAWYFS